MEPADPLEGICTATSKRSGARCRKPAIPGGTVCRMHGGAAPQVQAKAQDRLLALQVPAIARIGELIAQKEYPSTAFAAAKYTIDQTMGTPVEAVRMEHSGGVKLVVEWGGDAAH